MLLELALATPICLGAAWPFYVRAVQSVRNRSLNMFTLIAIGVVVAWGHSVLATAAPSVFPAEFKSSNGHVDLYFEAAAVIVTAERIWRFQPSQRGYRRSIRLVS